MKRGKISAKKTSNVSLAKVARTSGRILGIVIAAGVALIAATDKIMKTATEEKNKSAEEEEEPHSQVSKPENEEAEDIYYNK